MSGRYLSINEVPYRWRRLDGIPLTIPQIESILDKAEADPQGFAASFGKHKRDFVNTHHEVNGQWVSN